MDLISPLLLQSSPRNPALLGIEAHSIVASLKSHTDRETAVIGAALIEASLRSALLSRLVSDFDVKIFDDGFPLGSFGFRRQVAFAFGLLHPDLNKDIQQIGRLRNIFAHSAKHVDFNTQSHKPDIKSTCQKFCMPSRYSEVAAWITSLTEPPGGIADDGKRGLSVSNSLGQIIAEFYFEDEDLVTPKGRYIVTVGLAHIALMMLSLQAGQRVRANRRRHRTPKKLPSAWP